VITDTAAQTTETIDYDLMHIVPPQSAPDWSKESPLADPDNPAENVQIDKNTRCCSLSSIYSLHPAPSIPLIDTTRERTDMWYLKGTGLQWLCWNMILTGRL
jgi:hypothetical protein